ncbi:MAG: DUF1152 domain-containing protein [Micropruina sp.]|uniref:DUF1152 domain-containing protein n=1 Tax=Micropruina sp. TaxID=2737536 RepID=UPI0039E6AB86
MADSAVPRTSSLDVPPLWAALAQSDRVLIAGAGGGFDVYAGLPIALRLAWLGKRVRLANLSFSDLGSLDADAWLSEGCARIEPDAPGRRDYFPERTLVRWLRSEGYDWEVHAIARAGVRPVKLAYDSLIDDFAPDALVLVDGGTDILLRGDESGLGTPEEDAVSLVATSQLTVPTKLVVSLGFGVDAHHGVTSAEVLARLADLARDGAYLGALSIPPDAPEALAYVDAVAHAALHNSARPSIVNGQISAAIQGFSGQPSLPGAPAVTDLFVNPLMAVYFTVRLDALAAKLLYGDAIRSSTSLGEVSRQIENLRARLSIPAPVRFPH